MVKIRITAPTLSNLNSLYLLERLENLAAKRDMQLPQTRRIYLNMKVLPFLLLLICHIGFSQTDTVRVDIEEMSINFKTCECILFGGCRSYSFPSSKYWKSADSLFISNSDTIYLLLSDHGVLKIEGAKLPENEAYGEVKFYNKNSELVKIEIWDIYYLQHGDDWAAWSDAPDWKKQMVYKNGELIRETTKSIIHDDEKGFARRIETNFYKNGIKKRTKNKYQYF